MTTHEEENQNREGNAQGRGEERGHQDKSRVTGHPPIIIPDGGVRFNSFKADDGSSTSAANHEDIAVEFDGTAVPNEHYRPDSSGFEFTGSGLSHILHVKVRHDQGGHTCLEGPIKCRIFVTDKNRDNAAEREIVIDATSGSTIVIRFPDDYVNRTTGNRKEMRGLRKKIKRLIIRDPDGRLLHDCDEVRENKDCLICICDDCDFDCALA